MLPLWICLWTFDRSRSYCLTWGKKKRKRKKRRGKKPPLLTLNQPSEFCWSSWTPQAEVGWASLFFFPMVLPGWGLVWAAIFPVAQPPAQIFHKLPAPTVLCARPVPLIHQFCHSPSGAPPSCSLRGHSGWAGSAS